MSINFKYFAPKYLKGHSTESAGVFTLYIRILFAADGKAGRFLLTFFKEIQSSKYALRSRLDAKLCGFSLLFLKDYCTIIFFVVVPFCVTMFTKYVPLL